MIGLLSLLCTFVRGLKFLSQKITKEAKNAQNHRASCVIKEAHISKKSII